MDSPASPDPRPTYRLEPSMLRMLNRLPKEMVQRFSDDELVALQRAISNSTKPPIALRFSLPFLPRRPYVFLQAGMEPHSDPPRPEGQQPWGPLGTAIAVSLSLVAFLMAYTATYRLTQRPAQAEAPGEFHPTALPWIETEAACQGPNRTWQDNLCYDAEHRPEF